MNAPALTAPALTAKSLTEAAAAAARELRACALAVDADPDRVAPGTGSPALGLVHAACIPRQFRADGRWNPVLDTWRLGSRDRIGAIIELARGDAGAMLALKGPPGLAGVIVDALGSPAQRERFYRRIAHGRTWTFFAMTEPAHGSDATAMTTRLERDAGRGYRLYGEKRYVGNGARGGIGVVFARTGASPLTIRAVLLECPAPELAGRRLDTLGLRGAALSELTFDGVRISEEMLLGQHLPASRRGLWGAVRTFNSMRLQIGAMGIGTALAILDLVREVAPDAPGLDIQRGRTAAARALACAAADEVDANPNPRLAPSVTKLAGAWLAVSVARWARTTLGPACLLRHPLLEKWTRDAQGLEFMEGTSNVQRLHVADGYLRGVARG